MPADNASVADLPQPRDFFYKSASSTIQLIFPVAFVTFYATVNTHFPAYD